MRRRDLRQETVEHHLRYTRSKVGFILAQGLKGRHELPPGVRFQDKSAYPGPQDVPNHILGLVHGDHDDVRLEFMGFLDCLAAALGLTADLPTAMSLNQGPQTTAYHVVVVDE